MRCAELAEASIFVASVTPPFAGGEKICVFLQTLNSTKE